MESMITNVYTSDICLSVEEAIRERCYLADLALSLTVLDIYGVIEYDSMRLVTAVLGSDT